MRVGGFIREKGQKSSVAGGYWLLPLNRIDWAKSWVRPIFPLNGLKLSTLVHDKNVYLVQPERADTGMRQLQSRL